MTKEQERRKENILTEDSSSLLTSRGATDLAEEKGRKTRTETGGAREGPKDGDKDRRKERGITKKEGRRRIREGWRHKKRREIDPHAQAKRETETEERRGRGGSFRDVHEPPRFMETTLIGSRHVTDAERLERLKGQWSRASSPSPFDDSLRLFRGRVSTCKGPVLSFLLMVSSLFVLRNQSLSGGRWGRWGLVDQTSAHLRVGGLHAGLRLRRPSFLSATEVLGEFDPLDSHTYPLSSVIVTFVFRSER